MDETPIIQHWLVAVARAATLPGSEELSVAADADTPGTWDLVAMSTGLTPDELATHVAAHYGIGKADLSEVQPHARRMLPGRVARKHRVLPLRVTDRDLWVATSDPVGLEAEKAVAHVSGRNVHVEVAPPGPLSDAVDAIYPDEEPVLEIPPLELEARGGPRILVVDDDRSARHLLRGVLENAGYRVAEAADGRTALDLMNDQTDPVALVTLDLDLPDVPGLDVLRELRAKVATQAVPVIVATGLGDAEVEVELFEAGADDFVLKPVDPRRFVVRVEAVLRRR